MAGVYTDVRKAIRRAAIQSLIEYFPTTQEQNDLIFFSHINGSEPSKPYIVINILSIEQQGKHMTSTLASPADNTLLVRVAYEITVQFSFCGSSAGDMAQTFTQAINNNPLSLEGIKREKLSVMRKSNTRRAPQKRDTQWVEYFNQDVVFSYIVVTKQAIEWVEAVVIENAIDSDSGTEPSDTFSVPNGIIYP